MKQQSTTTQAMPMTFVMAISLARDLFQQSKLHMQACCGTIVKLNATGSGSASLDVLGVCGRKQKPL
jgi:hypothetical protein